jgi:segregation and condensation protein A
LPAIDLDWTGSVGQQLLMFGKLHSSAVQPPDIATLMIQFQVDIEQYFGPLDLLLHIVRREEIELSRLPLAKVIDQYFDYLEVLVELEIDDVAEFLEIASLLIELKSKQAIPETPAESGGDDQPVAEISDDLVERLIQYKRIRDASSILEEQSRCWQLRYSRLSNDLPARRIDSGSQPIQQIEVWDLVSAFSRILRERHVKAPQQVLYDDTPIHVHMQRIHKLVCESERVELTSLFTTDMHKSSLVALFLATLELTRHYGLSTEQTEPCRPLYLVAGPNFERVLQVHEIDNLSNKQSAGSNLPTLLR